MARQKGKTQAPKRKPRTVDGEVTPIRPVPDTSLADAIAEHFGIEPESISGFVVSAEYNHEVDGNSMTTLSSAWSVGVPVWRLRAFAAELLKHLDNV
jgi:hypothetical protein